MENSLPFRGHHGWYCLCDVLFYCALHGPATTTAMGSGSGWHHFCNMAEIPRGLTSPSKIARLEVFKPRLEPLGGLFSLEKIYDATHN